MRTRSALPFSPGGGARGRWTAVVALAVIVVAGACQSLGGPQTPAASGAGGSPGASASGGGGGGTTQLSIATGGTGGVYYPLGGGFAQVIREHVPGHDATVQETNASVDNMQLIGNGGAHLALVLGDTAADAVEGRPPFESAVPACTLGRLYDNYTQVVTSSETGITSIEDLRDKRVSLGAPGSGTEIIALRILEAAGIDPDQDIERQQLAVDETVNGLRDGTVDAGFWSGGLPTGALTEYATGGEMVLLPTAEYTDAVAEEYGPFYLTADIEAGTYEGQDEAVSTIVVPNVLVANTNMAEDLQQQVTAAIFDHKEDLVAVHAAAEALDPQTAGDVEFMDVCPGAQAYFDEQ